MKTRGIQREQWKPIKKALKESPVLSGFKVMKMENAVILTEGDCSILIRHSPGLNYYDIICFVDTVDNLKKSLHTDSLEEAYFGLQDKIPGVSFTFNEDGMVMVRGIVLLEGSDIAVRCIVRMAENCAYAFRRLAEGPAENTEEIQKTLEKTLEDTFVEHQTMNNGSMPTTMVKLAADSYEVTENNIKNVISCDAGGEGFNSITTFGRIGDMDEKEGSFFEKYSRTFGRLACPSVGVDRKGKMFYGIHIDKERMNGLEIIFTSLYNQMETSMAQFARMEEEKSAGKTDSSE